MLLHFRISRTLSALPQLEFVKKRRKPYVLYVLYGLLAAVCRASVGRPVSHSCDTKKWKTTRVYNVFCMIELPRLLRFYMSASVTLPKKGGTFKIVLKKKLKNRNLKETLTL